MTKFIAVVTGLLTLIIAAIGFALSYSALYQVAIDNGVPAKLAALWPLLIDFALISFSVGVLNAKLTNRRVWPAWTLVAFFTVLTLFFNAVHAGTGDIVKLIVAFVPPVALFFSFERFMFQVSDNLSVKADVKPVQAAPVVSVKADVKPLVKVVKPELTERQEAIVNNVKSGVVTVTVLTNEIAASRPTVTSDVKYLVDKGVLHRGKNKQLECVNGKVTK